MNMKNQLHQNHTQHLEILKKSINVAKAMLTQDHWTHEQRESISQEKAIKEMMFECGIKAFMK